MDRYLCAILMFTGRVLLAYPTPVDFSGQISRWNINLTEPTVSYAVRAQSSYDEAFFGNLTDDAAKIWNEVPSSYLKLVPSTANEPAQITVEFVENISNSSFSAGFATFDKFDDDHNPVHCKISVLSDLHILTLQKTILHELGHCLGLGHTLVPEAIMSYSLDKNSYALDTDDRAALSRIYPADGSTPQLPPGCSTPSWLGRTQMLHWPFLILLLFPLTMRPWRKLK